MVRKASLQTSRRLKNSDFDNIKYSALNVNQNKYCKIDESGKISRRSHRLCWKMPEFDDYGNYESNDYEPIYNEDKWVLIEEIRNFQTILKDFMKHPVTSEKEIKKRQMLNDLNIYQERLNLGRYPNLWVKFLPSPNPIYFREKLRHSNSTTSK